MCDVNRLIHFVATREISRLAGVMSTRSQPTSAGDGVLAISILGVDALENRPVELFQIQKLRAVLSDDDGVPAEVLKVRREVRLPEVGVPVERPLELDAFVVVLGDGLGKQGEDAGNLGIRVNPRHVRLRFEAIEELGDLEERADDAIDHICHAPAASCRVVAEGRVEFQPPRPVQDKRHLEQGELPVPPYRFRVHLIEQELERRQDCLREAVHDDAVHELHVTPPVRRRVRHAKDLVRFLDEGVDVLAVGLDLIVDRALHALEELAEAEHDDGQEKHGGGRERGFQNARTKHPVADRLTHRFLGPSSGGALDRFQVVLHRPEDVVDNLDLRQGLADERADSLGLPAQRIKARPDGQVKLGEERIDQGLLHRQHGAQDGVVHSDDEVEVASPGPEGVRRLVDVKGGLRNGKAEEEEILDLPKETDQRRIEVRDQMARLLRPAQEGHRKTRARGRVDVATPFGDLLLLVVQERRHDGPLDLDDLLGLLPVEDVGREGLHLLHRDARPRDEAPAPGQGAPDGGQVAHRLLRRVGPVSQELLLDDLQVLAVRTDQGDLLHLDLVLDDGAVEELPIESIDDLEAPVYGLAVVKGEADHRAEPPLDLLDELAEGGVLRVELGGVDVHDVVLETLHLVHGTLEVLLDLVYGRRERAALRPADLDLGKLGELDDGPCQLQYVVGPLDEAVETGEHGVVLDRPLFIGAVVGHPPLVVLVGLLEAAAHLQHEHELLHGDVGLLVVDQREDLLARDEPTALRDHRVAHLPDEDDQPTGRVVVLGVLPDEHDSVEDGLERRPEIREVVVVQLVDPAIQRPELLRVVVRLESGRVNLLAQPGERRAVCALGLVQRPQHASRARTLELVEYRVETIGLLLPEQYLDVRGGVEAQFQLRFGVLLQHVFDLLRPGNNRALEERDSAAARRRRQRGRRRRRNGVLVVFLAAVVLGRRGQSRLGLDLAAENGRRGKEGVEAILVGTVGLSWFVWFVSTGNSTFLETSSRCSKDDIPPISATKVDDRTFSSVTTTPLCKEVRVERQTYHIHDDSRPCPLTVFDTAKHFDLGRRGIAATIFMLSGMMMHFASSLSKKCSSVSLGIEKGRWAGGDDRRRPNDARPYRVCSVRNSLSNLAPLVNFGYVDRMHSCTKSVLPSSFQNLSSFPPSISFLGRQR
ncbi:hypothetical protein THAOC_34904 [Thalassiosira oceanica]|uniref:Uncharacterized protein n=1 Tax=Thalassiosira oceanica TaxID=159749 RepID=K0RIE8_THAOC|nr:hypothetical protein THAOC_34904 [Thalassiosira oceanica]|eukprot:EJK46427.1 hypothetical protein THAOC_34904 [Thalassiosira oceanica]